MVLVEQKLVQSRERAKRLIMAGKVLVDGVPVDKPGTQIDPSAAVTLRGEDIPYVSRGGLKLEKGLESFEIDVSDRICLDVGTSTGGFTDCLLQRGAKKVYAVDVGYGQLAWKLRQNPQVVPLERTNIRNLPATALAEKIDIATIDVSFISLRIVVPAVLKFLQTHASILALVKPQFEVGRGQVGKGGVVRDSDLHQEVIQALNDFFRSLGLQNEGVVVSPILGPKGNREFIVCLSCPTVSHKP